MIVSFSFGNIVVGGTTYHHDIKMIRDRVIAEWWRQSGHRVAIEDVADLLADKPQVLVLGKGSPGLMSASDELKRHLTVCHIQLIEQKTADAIHTYNRILDEGHPVAAGFHVGC